MRNIDRCCQLHERIEILYVVTGWQIQLLTQDGAYIAIELEGETVQDAIDKLEKALESHTLQTVRKLHTKQNPRY